MKKYFIMIISLVLLLTGCNNSDNISTTTSDCKYETEENTIASYEYPDEYFNKNITKDEQGNYYFVCNKSLYKYDMNGQLISLMDLLIDEHTLVSLARYYNGYLYLQVRKLGIDRNQEAVLGIGRVDTDGSNYEYLFDIEKDVVLWNRDDVWFIEYNILTISIASMIGVQNKEPRTLQYSLDTYSLIKDTNMYLRYDRSQFYKELYPSITYGADDQTGMYVENLYELTTMHIYDNKFYSFVDFNQEAFDNYCIILSYGPFDDEVDIIDVHDYLHEYQQGRSPYYFYADFIDGQWFVFGSKGLYQTNLDFTDGKRLMDSCFDQYVLTDKEQRFVINPNGKIIIPQ